MKTHYNQFSTEINFTFKKKKKKKTARFALPICLQNCYQFCLLTVMKWGGEWNTVPLLPFMKEAIHNINKCSLKEARRSFQSFISLVWVWVFLCHCKKSQTLNHNSSFSSDDHASTRVVLLQHGDSSFATKQRAQLLTILRLFLD